MLVSAVLHQKPANDKHLPDYTVVYSRRHQD